MSLASLLRTVAVAVLAALFASVPMSVGAADPFEINVILPMTGTFAFLAKEEAASLGVAESVVNKSGGIRGRPIKFVIQDDQSSAQTAVQLANGVIAKKVSVVLGSSGVAQCSAMAPLMKDGPVMYCFSPGIYPPEGSYVFSSSLATQDLLGATIRYYRELGYTKLALIASTDASGQDGEKRFDVALAAPENKGEAVVDREHFNLTDVSVAAQMTHIKSSGAQAMVAWVSGTPFGTILRGTIDAGLTIPIMTSTANLTYPQLETYGTNMPDNVLFPGSPGDALDVLSRGPVKSAVQTYLDAFKAAGLRADQGHTLAWDPAMLIVSAYKKFGFEATPQQIRDYLMGLQGWTGIDGIYDFHAVPQRGLNISSVIIVRWLKDKDRWVSVSKPGGAPLK
jgi:branched-chain amino acid transport system substrate-binding protein